jgi:hypothetical protein
MTELTLNIDGSSTVEADNLTTLSGALETLTQAHEAGDAVRVTSGSLRWRDGAVWVQASLELPTSVADIDANKDVLAQVAVDVGMHDSVSEAMEEINVS